MEPSRALRLRAANGATKGQPVGDGVRHSPTGCQLADRETSRSRLTRTVPKLIERLEARAVELVVRFEDDAKELVIRRNPSRLLNAAVAGHLPVDGLVIRKLDVIAGGLRRAAARRENIGLGCVQLCLG